MPDKYIKMYSIPLVNWEIKMGVNWEHLHRNSSL